MPIFDQGYQHWNGELSGPVMRWWAITRRGVETGLKKKGVKALVLAAFVPALLLVVALSLWGLFEHGSDTIKTFMDFFAPFLPAEIKENPAQYRVMVWTFLFDWFLRAELWFTLFLTLSVGPDLISQDLRFNAIPLYFSKPVRRIDYFIGKLGVIGAFVAAVMVAPILLAYFCGLLFSFSSTVLADTFRLFLGSVTFGAIVVASMGALMLAISSISRNSRIVGAIFAGLVFISLNFGAVLDARIDRPWCPLISYTDNLYRVQRGLLNTSGAWKRWQELQQILLAEAEAKSRQMGPAAFLSLESRRGARSGAANRPAFSKEQEERIGEAIRRGRQRQLSWLERRANERYPTWHSAAVLASIFAASCFVLTRRVKSLDTLK